MIVYRSKTFVKIPGRFCTTKNILAWNIKWTDTAWRECNNARRECS